MNEERITPHFRAREFACRCGRPECDAPPMYRPLVTRVLEPARRALERPVVVTSGARCAAHNRAVGGAPDSRHLTGHAADVAVAGADGRRWLVRLFALLELAGGRAAGAAAGPTGLGLYLHPGHVHVDYGSAIPWRRWVVGRDGRPVYV